MTILRRLLACLGGIALVLGISLASPAVASTPAVTSTSTIEQTAPRPEPSPTVTSESDVAGITANAQTAAQLACSYCLVIQHGSGSKVTHLTVAQDSAETCDNSVSGALPRTYSTNTYFAGEAWDDARCFYLGSLHDAKVTDPLTGSRTWVCSEGWKALTVPQPSVAYRKVVEIYANNSTHC